MAKKEDLRRLRAGTIINATSKEQETEVIKALQVVVKHLEVRFGSRIKLAHERQWLLQSIVAELHTSYPEVDFHCHFSTSSIKPDGGILFMKSVVESKITYPILIAEAKNQGTNDRREKEGLPKQAKGNAIERLGKNLIGLRTALMRESIFPFVCFGYGCDFDDGSSILDRVTTMAMFGYLNKTYLHNQESGRFNRGSFYFRCDPWKVEEMAAVMKDVAERSVQYYFSKYKESHFVR